MSLLIENDPRVRGLGPDGGPLSSDMHQGQAVGILLGEAIKSRRFISLYIACMICSLGVFVPFVHLVPYALDHGIPQSAAVLLLGMIGVGSTAGRFFLGGLADRLGRRQALLVMFAGMAFAMVLWTISVAIWSLAAFALVFGIFYGGGGAGRPGGGVGFFCGRRYCRIV